MDVNPSRRELTFLFDAVKIDDEVCLIELGKVIVKLSQVKLQKRNHVDRGNLDFVRCFFQLD